MKKTFSILFILIVLIGTAFADSETFDTEILSVSFGPHNFGYGLAPIGTDYRYKKYFSIHDSLRYDAYFEFRLEFLFPDRVLFDDYDYKTGNPYWATSYKNYKENSNFIYGRYFNPTGISKLLLSQGFGINPIEGKGYLVKLTFSFNNRYSEVLEELNVNRGQASPIFFNPATNSFNEPFGPGSYLQAFPWLQDTRKTLSNYVTAKINIDLTKSRGYGIYDGIDFALEAEYGPRWLGNNISMNSPTSDYYNLYFSMTEYLSLYSAEQDNGWNWLTIELIHDNSIQHTGGPIVPWNKLPRDRLRNEFVDKLYFKIYGPQFIANDCVTDMDIGITNKCLWGHVVNELPQTTYAVEWISSIDLNFHMRLFGFMHFRYSTWYEFGKGIKAQYPQFYQAASVSFYISL